MANFHEVRFPIEISLGSRGGPERRTDVIALGSGREERNARWAHSRRRYEAGYGVKSLAAIELALAFFEERRGRLYGFRWRDAIDHASSPAGTPPSATDQALGAGDGSRSAFALVKIYGGAFAPYQRPIRKPVAGSVRVAVAGAAKAMGVHFDVDHTTGVVNFRPGHIPATGQSVTAGFVFDTPVRFDSDRLEINLAAFQAGDIPNIPLVEILA